MDSAILKPAGNLASSLIVELSFSVSILLAVLPEKHEIFRLLIREMGFKWSWDNYRWERRIGPTAGDPTDRLAEIAHRLVAAGFLVRIHDEAAWAKAIAGDFTPEQTRWVTKALDGPFAGWLKIRWARSEDYYGAARSLPGSRYKQGAVYVPAGAGEDVADFAGRYGFALSPGAQELLDSQRTAIAQGVILDAPKVSKRTAAPDDVRVPRALSTPEVALDAALLDHD
jgi:hypothetical protein